MAQITLQGNAIETIGDLPKAGQSAPEFVLTDGELQDKKLADYAGKKILLNIFPSIDTPVCAISTQKFNQYAEQNSDAVMLMVSADLPFALGRFCGSEGLDNVQPLSMMRDRKFAKDYGILITTGPLAGITARAIVVIDENGKVKHSELVGEIADEPNYEAALSALSD